MTVALFPPNNHSLWGTPKKRPPLTEGPRYLRGRNWSRWHRPRSGYHMDHLDHVTWNLWCGQGFGSTEVLAADEVPDGEDVCGTCVGRALGAKQDELPPGLPMLRFDPRWMTPPALCPGSMRPAMVIAVERVGRCRACSALLPVRAGGSRYNPTYGVIRHAPGPDLVPPCPWHAWRHIGPRGDDGAGCICGWREPADLVSAAARWSDAT